MTRPAFRLSDNEARILVPRLQAINDMHPVNQRDHRPFVRAFIRAVHEATHKTFSPAIYRRLLAAYAPERRPSTSTLAIEKELFSDELALERAGAAEVAASDAPQLAALIRAAVAEAVGDGLAIKAYGNIGGGADVDVAFWRDRLAEVEAALADARASAARLAGELLAARAVADSAGAELAAARQALERQGAQLAKLTDEVKESRRFAMRAIDDARGETRAWRDQCAAIEAKAAAKAREDHLLLETFRQLAYQRGAAIPPVLQKGVK
jgi:hypothetical protein